jgi:murein DD-endopeptidase MepM/ murein hydrolase activator NlpD
VRAGEQLGNVGNSGGSQAPHLHFHVVSGPGVSAANGFPFVFDTFLVAGAADSADLLAALTGDATFPRDPGDPVPHELEMPLSYVMVDFPARDTSATRSRRNA